MKCCCVRRGLESRVALAMITIAMLLTIPALPQAAQSVASATIQGTVKDEQGGRLPGVSVTLTSPALLVGRLVTVTDSAGGYRFPDLPAGLYRASFQLQGF